MVKEKKKKAKKRRQPKGKLSASWDMDILGLGLGIQRAIDWLREKGRGVSFRSLEPMTGAGENIKGLILEPG